MVAGHTRLAAALKIGLKKVPCIVLDLDPEQARQYRLIDNKTGELSGWDVDKLFSEISSIPEIDMSAFGFTKTFEEPDDDDSDEELDFGSSGEVDLDDFDDDQFDFECPYCGFRWNE